MVKKRIGNKAAAGKRLEKKGEKSAHGEIERIEKI